MRCGHWRRTLVLMMALVGALAFTKALVLALARALVRALKIQKVRGEVDRLPMTNRPNREPAIPPKPAMTMTGATRHATSRQIAT